MLMQSRFLRSAKLLLVASLAFAACDGGDPSGDTSGVNSFDGVWAESDPAGAPDYLSVEFGRMRYYDQFEGNECYLVVGEANSVRAGSGAYTWSLLAGLVTVSGTVGSSTLTVTNVQGETNEFIKTNRDTESIDVCLE
jgi:hypothetical protein